MEGKALAEKTLGRRDGLEEEEFGGLEPMAGGAKARWARRLARAREEITMIAISG
jgi:hypothetical protein